MDDKAVDAVPAANPPDGAVLEIEGVEVASFTAVVGRLCVDYPDVASNRIETILLREWDAFMAGRPPVRLPAVQAGVRARPPQPCLRPALLPRRRHPPELRISPGRRRVCPPG